MERALDWYDIAKKDYGERISNGSLYLITGFYKARSWSLASFRDATTTGPRNLTLVPRKDGDTTAGRDWKCTFSVQYRDGPGPSHNGSVNQTVFVNGFKIAVRDDVFGWLFPKSEVQQVPAVPPRKGRYDCCTRFLTWLFGERNYSKPPHGANGGADAALSQVGIIGLLHVCSMTHKHF